MDSDTTTYTLDVAGGLPHVIVETTGSDSDLYLTGLAQFQNDAWAYQHPDGLGSVRQLTDSSVQVTLAQTYDPFGNLLEQSGNGASGFGYTGEQEDANTGLVFLRARFYDPSTGRFVSRDPWKGDHNKPHTMFPSYQYVGNNPVNLTDPSGLKEWQPSTSWQERLIGREHEQGMPNIHLEYPMPLGRWRPDILNSITGEVFEIKPLLGGTGIPLAAVEANIYAEGLNRFKADTILGGPVGLLPQSDPNNWNTIDWHPGAPSSFRPMYFRGGVPYYSIHDPNPIVIWNPYVDMVAISLAPGAVNWFYVLKPEVIAAATAVCVSEKFLKYLEAPKNRLAPALNTPIIILPEYYLDPELLSCLLDPGLCEGHQG